MAEHERHEPEMPDSVDTQDESVVDLSPDLASTEAEPVPAAEEAEASTTPSDAASGADDATNHTPVATTTHESSEAIESPVDEVEDDTQPEVEPSEDEDDEEDELERGMLLEGTVLKTSPTEIQVDLGEYGQGVINSRELERLTSSTLETLQEGTNILVYVLNSPSGTGEPVLSISRALEESDWRKAEEYLDNKEVYHGKVAGYNKGGLIVRFGRLRGFVPASQISPERRDQARGDSPEERWGSMLGDSIYVKVVELKRSRNRLILSEQAAVREIREDQKLRLLQDLTVGERRKGRVTSITDFGAFVDLGGADGLVHLTELSWKHVTHPSEALEVGQEVEVEVISIDVDNRRIGLSMRRVEHDPWAEVEDQYVSGQLIQASITKLTKFGAFARLVDHPEIEGLIHVSELSEHRVRHPREVVSKGDVLTLRIIRIDKEQRRLGLSLKQVDSSEFMDIDWTMTDAEQGDG